jgi:hypothetical protein
MSAIEHTYEQIVAYLKGLLSNLQRHELEKKMMQDSFDDDAFEGLSQLKASELESDMDALTGRLNTRINRAKKRSLTPVFRMAAAIVLLIGIAGILYFVFTTPSQELITQETGDNKKAAPAETAIPEAPRSVKGIAADSQPDEKSKEAREPQLESQHGAEHIEEPGVTAETEPAAEFKAKAEAAAEAVKPESETEPRKSLTVKQPAAADQVTSKAMSEQAGTMYITGKVVGSDGEALPGVAVIEKGTSHGTLTDIDGNFSLQLNDTGARLALSYVGYQPLELGTGDVAHGPVVMQEDILALEEVVVIGYGVQKKRDVTGAVSSVESDEIATGGGVEPYNFIKPVPPEGTLKAFKSWMNEKTDTSQFRPFPGKHRIQVILSIQDNGSVRDIRIKSTAPSVINAEYRRVISQSPPWKPALKDNVPVESQVVIRFVITVK